MQLKIYKKIAALTLTYGSETTTKQELQAQDTKLEMIGWENTDSREELNILNLNNKKRENSRQWHEHLNKMKKIKFPPKALHYKCKDRSSI